MKNLGAVAAALAASAVVLPVQAQSLRVDLAPASIPGGLASLIAPVPPPRPDMLPDGAVSAGSGVLRHAWLTQPTRRYDHGVIGDAVEAGGMAIQTSDNSVLTLTLGTDAVFEDRLARIVTLDGTESVLSVKSYLAHGSAVAIAQIDGTALRIAAESPPIGTSHRWLNPVGVADFDGDGRDEVAAILTPHIGGLLTLYRRNGAALRQTYQASGFSNHAIGTRELGWSSIVDANGDGIADIVAPDTTRNALRIVTFAGGRFAELARVSLPAGLKSSFVVPASTQGAAKEIYFDLADGKTYRLSFAPIP